LDGPNYHSLEKKKKKKKEEEEEEEKRDLSKKLLIFVCLIMEIAKHSAFYRFHLLFVEARSE
jgi:hypothetical protein